MSKIYLGIGSNIGHRKANLEEALDRLKERVSFTKVSSFYETEPVDYLDQPWFLNIVAEGETTLTPQELLQFAQRVEQDMKRVKTVRFGPRTIDVDILLYDDVEMDTPDLTLPHPRMRARNFVMVPLSEIAPDLIIGGESVTQILAALKGEAIRKWAE